MKSSSLFVLICFILCSGSCNQKEKTKTLSDVRFKVTYESINTDTIVTKKDLSMYNEPYHLTIAKYCLNDSNVVNDDMFKNGGRNGKLNYSHNYAHSVILTKYDKVIFSKNITKEVFKDSLNSQVFKQLVLQEIKYGGVRTNRLYFTAKLGTPDKDKGYEVTFAIFYLTEKIGQIDYWVTGECKN